jgi:hypothetical protein
MLIDSKATMAGIKQSPQSKGIVAELADALSFAKEDKKLSDDDCEMLKDLVCWLFALGEEEHVLQMGELLLKITPSKDKRKWAPIELALCMPWLLAQRAGDASLAARYPARIEEGYGKEDPKFRPTNEKVRLRQMNGEHLHDDEIAKAQAAQTTWMEVRAWSRQLSRLCWILARGGSEKMPKALLEEKIAPCVAFLRAHTDITLAEVYPG